MTRNIAPSLFDQMAKTPAGRWMMDFGLVLDNEVTNAASTGLTWMTPGYSSGSTSDKINVSGPLSQIRGSASFDLSKVTGMETGDVVEVITCFEASAFINLNLNKICGVGLADKEASSGDTYDDYAGSAADMRAFVGFDSAGDIFVITSDGTTLTKTDTGINYTAGTKIRVRMQFKKGTHFKVWIDDNAPTTKTTNLPTDVSVFGFTHGAPTSAYSARWYGGRGRFYEG